MSTAMTYSTGAEQAKEIDASLKVDGANRSLLQRPAQLNQSILEATGPSNQMGSRDGIHSLNFDGETSSKVVSNDAENNGASSWAEDHDGNLFSPWDSGEWRKQLPRLDGISDVPGAQQSSHDRNESPCIDGDAQMLEATDRSSLGNHRMQAYPSETPEAAALRKRITSAYKDGKPGAREAMQEQIRYNVGLNVAAEEAELQRRSRNVKSENKGVPTSRVTSHVRSVSSYATDIFRRNSEAPSYRPDTTGSSYLDDIHSSLRPGSSFDAQAPLVTEPQEMRTAPEASLNYAKAGEDVHCSRRISNGNERDGESSNSRVEQDVAGVLARGQSSKVSSGCLPIKKITSLLRSMSVAERRAKKTKPVELQRKVYSRDLDEAVKASNETQVLDRMHELDTGDRRNSRASITKVNRRS